MIWLYLIMATGAYIIMISMIMKTKTWGLFFIFKMLPFFLGLASILYSLKELGWV